METKYSILRSWFVVVMGLLVSAGCVRAPREESVAQKIVPFPHNYLVIRASDGSTAEVSLTYSVRGADGVNTVVKRTGTTPCMLGGELVNVRYDSVVERSYNTGAHIRSHRTIRRDFTPGGADYMILENLSQQELEVCVVGAEPLVYYSLDEVEALKLDNFREINAKRMVAVHPSPLYRRVPVLYLLRPNLAPEGDWVILPANGGVWNARTLQMGPAKFGEFEGKTPVSIDEVVALYRAEFSEHDVLFNNNFNTDAYYLNHLKDCSLASTSNGDKGALQHYRKLGAGAKLENKGDVWIVATRLGQSKMDQIEDQERGVTP